MFETSFTRMIIFRQTKSCIIFLSQQYRAITRAIILQSSFFPPVEVFAVSLSNVSTEDDGSGGTGVWRMSKRPSSGGDSSKEREPRRERSGERDIDRDEVGERVRAIGETVASARPGCFTLQIDSDNEEEREFLEAQATVAAHYGHETKYALIFDL